MFRQGDAWIRKSYPGIIPETLEFEAWRKLYAESLYLYKTDHENNHKLIKSAVLESADVIIKAFNGNVDTNNKMDS